jgi:hypothetical protein
VRLQAHPAYERGIGRHCARTYYNRSRRFCQAYSLLCWTKQRRRDYRCGRRRHDQGGDQAEARRQGRYRLYAGLSRSTPIEPDNRHPCSTFSARHASAGHWHGGRSCSYADGHATCRASRAFLSMARGILSPIARRYRRPRIAGNVSLATPRHVSLGPERASTLRPVPGWPQQEQTARRPLRRPGRK